MRVLSLVALIALVSSFEATSADVNSHKTDVAKFNSDIAFLSRGLAVDHDQVKRSLRRNDDDEDLELDSDDEERGGGTQLIDDAVNKMDDVLMKGVQTTEKLPSKWAGAVKKIKDLQVPLRAVKLKYPAGLSESTTKQLVLTEIQRADDIANGVKMSKTGDYKMQREIAEFPGMKTAPILTSNTGRGAQIYADKEKTIRELACIVTSRSREKGGGDVLLISSSNPTKKDWLLPKGGWDEGETIQKAALRELIEEGGVGGTIMHGLGKSEFKQGKKGYVYHSYWMNADDVFDQWPESIRYRIWVSFDDAELLLKDRPEMLRIVKATKEKAAQVKSGELSAMDESLAKIKLNDD